MLVELEDDRHLYAKSFPTVWKIVSSTVFSNEKVALRATISTPPRGPSSESDRSPLDRSTKICWALLR